LVSISSIHNDPGKKFYFSKFKFRAPLFFFLNSIDNNSKSFLFDRFICC
jgi:hypothetical protein